MLESQIQIHPTVGQQHWMRYGTNMDLTKHSISAARKVQFIWYVPPGASTLNNKKHIQTHLNGRNPESFEDRIIFMSMFSDTDWTKKGNAEICLHNTRESGSILQRNSSQDTAVVSGLRQRRRGGTEIPTNPKDIGSVSHCRWLTYLCVTLHIQYILRQLQHRLDTSGKRE